MFIPTKKPTSQILLQVVGYQLWAQPGSNQRPPDYEYSIFDKLSASKKPEKLGYLQYLQWFMLMDD
jgi:hypothetical protein